MGRGSCFFLNDFADLGSSDAIRKTLSRLEQAGKVRRVLRGLYDYPKFSQVLNQPLSPDIQQIAYALARKFNWRISPTGDTALNLLGLSTQVPGRYVYLCDGVTRVYEIGKVELRFQKTALKTMGFKYRQSELLVQAIKTLGRERVTPAVIAKLEAQLDEKQCKQILKDTQHTTTWIYEVIKQACKRAVNARLC